MKERAVFLRAGAGSSRSEGNLISLPPQVCLRSGAYRAGHRLGEC